MTSVLHIYKDYYPPVRGGIEQSIARLCEGLRERYDMSVLVAAGSNPPGEHEIRHGNKPGIFCFDFYGT